MDMILMPATELRELLIEAAGIAIKKNPPLIQPQMADELLTPEEAAKTLKVSKVTIWEWGKRGILNPRRIGNQVRYLRSEVLAAAKPKGGATK